MQSGLRGLDELIVAAVHPATPAEIQRRAALVIEAGPASSTVDFVAAQVLRAEVSARLDGADVELWVVGDDPVAHNWIGDGIHHVNVADLPALTSAVDAVVVWGHDAGDVPSVRVAEVAPELSSGDLLHMAARAWPRGQVRAINPFRASGSYIAVVVDRHLDLGRLHASELVRFARARGLELVLVRDGTDPSSGDLQAARAEIATTGLDATLGVEAGGMAQMLGALAEATVVVTMSHETGEIARAYHPRVAVIGPGLEVGTEVQRRLHAALDATPAPPRLEVAAMLDTIALAAAGTGPEGPSPELAHQLLQIRLASSRTAQTALLQRLLDERERAVAAQSRLRERIVAAEAERDAAVADADLARESARRQQAHLNALEVRVADLDQGPVAPPTPSIPLRLFNVFERVLFAVARRVRRRLTGA